jgi:orotidine-5'-phosphate decarboxylase
MTQPTRATDAAETSDAHRPTSYGARLHAATTTRGPLCVGIDPHPSLLADWGLNDDPAGLERFALTCVEALSGQVAVMKPQSAFFERHGSAGIAVLERTLEAIAAGGALSLLDVKRGDIGSTMSAYAQAYVGPASPLAADAITVSPYLGYESLRPVLELAAANGRGVYLLALTSNPEGHEVQHARGADGLSVAARMAAGAAQDNAGAQPLGSIGLVVGATVGDAPQRLGVDLAQVNGSLLAPGFGAQGGTADDLRLVFGPALANVLVSSSRGLLSAGPDQGSLRVAAARTVDNLRMVLGQPLHGDSASR